MLSAGLLDGNGDKVSGELFKLLAILYRLLEFGGICGANALTEVGTVIPELVLEVRADFFTGGGGTILGLDTAQFHRSDGGHLLEDSRAFGGIIER